MELARVSLYHPQMQQPHNAALYKGSIRPLPSGIMSRAPPTVAMGCKVERVRGQPLWEGKRARYLLPPFFVASATPPRPYPTDRMGPGAKIGDTTHPRYRVCKDSASKKEEEQDQIVTQLTFLIIFSLGPSIKIMSRT